jgi:hypothetical protein
MWSSVFLVVITNLRVTFRRAGAGVPSAESGGVAEDPSTRFEGQNTASADNMKTLIWFGQAEKFEFGMV